MRFVINNVFTFYTRKHIHALTKPQETATLEILGYYSQCVVPNKVSCTKRNEKLNMIHVIFYQRPLVLILLHPKYNLCFPLQCRVTVPDMLDSWTGCRQDTGRCWRCPRKCTNRDSPEFCSGTRCRSCSPLEPWTWPGVARTLPQSPAADKHINQYSKDTGLQTNILGSSEDALALFMSF